MMIDLASNADIFNQLIMISDPFIHRWQVLSVAVLLDET